MKLAVIPARSGSQRIKRKNVKLFNGKPIIVWSIEKAIASKIFDKIIVSTDDVEIAKISEDAGAEVPFLRPKELSDHFTGTNDVVAHAINWYKERDIQFSHTCCIYATAPFLEIGYLKEGFDKVVSNDCNYAFSVTSFPYPIFRSLKLSKEERIVPIYPENIPLRSQDFHESYHDAAQFYWGKSSAYIEKKSLFDGSAVPVFIPRHLVQDIDTLEDWTRAEYMFQALKLSANN